MSKKKGLFLVLTLMIIGLLCYFITRIAYKSKQKELSVVTLSQIPNFSHKDNLIKYNTPSVFIAFSPDCEHCQYEAKSINEWQKELQNTNIVLFTSANDSLTKAFSYTYGLDTIKNIQVISDKNDEMHKLFAVKTIPSIFIYNKDGQLVKQYKGETKIDAILKAIL